MQANPGFLRRLDAESALPLERREALAEALLDCRDDGDLNAWLEGHGSSSQGWRSAAATGSALGSECSEPGPSEGDAGT